MWIGCWITHRHGKFDQNKSDFNWMVWKRSKKMTKNWIKIEIKLRIFNQILWWILSVSMDFMVSMVFDRFWYILIDIFNQKWFEIHQIVLEIWQIYSKWIKIHRVLTSSFNRSLNALSDFESHIIWTTKLLEYEYE